MSVVRLDYLGLGIREWRDHVERGNYPPEFSGDIPSCSCRAGRKRWSPSPATVVSHVAYIVSPTRSRPFPNSFDGAFHQMYNDELPHDVILAIQRVLKLQPGENSDPLDELSDDFSPVHALNELFPDGVLKQVFHSYLHILCYDRGLFGPHRKRTDPSRRQPARTPERDRLSARGTQTESRS